MLFEGDLKKSQNIECIMCENPAEWVRCTQFAGDHPFCDGCAKKEDDFGEDDPSYFYWHKLPNAVWPGW